MPKNANVRWRRTTCAVAGLAVGLLALGACSSSGSKSSTGTTGSGSKVGVSLILKTLTNPYFVSMEKDAKTEAAKVNVNLTVAAGKTDGDTQTQISAIDNAISRGDKGILITENGDAVNAELNKARQAGLPRETLRLRLIPRHAPAQRVNAINGQRVQRIECITVSRLRPQRQSSSHRDRAIGFDNAHRGESVANTRNTSTSFVFNNST